MAAKESQQIDRALDRILKARFMGDLLGALSLAEQAVNWFPDSPAILGLAGDLNIRLEQPHRAIELFREVVRLSPRSEMASLTLFQLLWENGLRDQGIREMKRYLQLEPQSEYEMLLMGLGEL